MNRAIFKRLIIVACLLTVCLGPLSIGSAPVATASLDSFLESIIQPKEPGLAAMVMRNNEVLYMKGHGLSNLRRADKINEKSLFRLTSLSEPIVASVILRLVEEKKIKLKSSVSEYLDLPNLKSITIEQLLSHTSGLPDLPALHKQHWSRVDYMQNRDLVRILARVPPGSHTRPGEKFYYNATDYILLAQVIEKVTSQTFASAVRDIVFKPLSMNDSMAYNFKYPWSVKNRARGYRKNKADYKLDEDHPLNGLNGADGIYSSVYDMHTFEEALAGKTFLKPESKKAMFSTVKLNDGTNSGYALGWRVHYDEEKRAIAWQEGSWVGFRCRMTRYLSENFTIVLLSNNGNIEDDLEKINDEIYQHFHTGL